MKSVAIDGTAGAGKSTVAKLLAEKLGWNYLDTGAFYRAITYQLQKMNINHKDTKGIIKALECINIHIEYKNGEQCTFVNNENVSTKIRTEEIDKVVAYFSKIKQVRAKVVKLQRAIAKKNNVVIEGRDIGSDVLPETPNKFFLTATPEERAKRRYKQKIANGEVVDYQKILSDIKKRDTIDTKRKISPLKPAKDAKIFDTTNLNIQQVVNKLFDSIKQ